jgi:hypothetical protein
MEHPRRRYTDFDVDKVLFWVSVAIFAMAFPFIK